MQRNFEFCAREKEDNQSHQVLRKSFLKLSYLDHAFQLHVAKMEKNS